SIKPVEKKEYYTLSSAQKRLYVLQQMELESTAYNIPSATSLEGLLNLEKLEVALSKLIHRHESLRTTFHLIEEAPVQKVHPFVPFKIETMQVPVARTLPLHGVSEGGTGGDGDPGDGDPIAAAKQAFSRPFDISEAPLLRVGVIEITGKNPTNGILLVDIHHIITDGTSMELLTKELFALYAGENVPPLKLQYRDYAEWQNSRTHKQLMKAQEEYWVNNYSGELPVLTL
ncbi:MAG: hypothetical protein GY765_28760, partial [bacterium]|nr:hypothetical protein [bacterium]